MNSCSGTILIALSLILYVLVPEFVASSITFALAKVTTSVIDIFTASFNACVTVPGTFEIPVVVSNLINKFDAFVVLGCIIKGKTSHFHYLCSSVTNSLIDLSIHSKKPIGNGILTCNNKKQAIERADPNKKDKGGDAAYAVISVLKIIK